MSDLSSIEKVKLEKLFNMGSGYVLNFSDITLYKFIIESTKIDIRDSCYDCKSGSKANRLRAFWNKEPNHIVGKLTLDLLEYWKTQRLINYIEIKQIEQALFDECHAIAERLKQGGIFEHIDAIQSYYDDKDFFLIAKSIRQEQTLAEAATSPPKQPMSQTKETSVDIGIIIALKEEFREFFKQLRNPESFKDHETGVTDYLFFPEKAQNCKCAATFVGDMGPEKAALATERFIKRRQPKTVVMLGIAGGMSKDVKLGDVVVVTTANNYLHRGKVVPDGESFTFEMGGDPYRCSDDLVRAVQDLEFAHAQLFQDWQQEAKSRKEQDSLSQQLTENLVGEKPQFVEGAIVSSLVVGASEKFVNWLKQGNRNYLAIEMEGVGMLSAVYSGADPKKTLILRGISDFADERKQELDQVGKGDIRRYAMNNAISLLWKLIEAGVLENPR
jgi:nucleoside phosphorylase